MLNALSVGLPKTLPKNERSLKELDIRKFRDRALELPWNTYETGVESLWRVMKESPLVLQDKFVPSTGRRKEGSLVL